jgi:hypothetical protein
LPDVVDLYVGVDLGAVEVPVAEELLDVAKAGAD